MNKGKVRLPTITGAVEIEPVFDAGDCIACDRTGGGMARITVEHHDKVIRICGDCISSALAVHMRQSYASGHVSS